MSLVKNPETILVSCVECWIIYKKRLQVTEFGNVFFGCPHGVEGVDYSLGEGIGSARRPAMRPCEDIPSSFEPRLVEPPSAGGIGTGYASDPGFGYIPDAAVGSVRCPSNSMLATAEEGGKGQEKGAEEENGGEEEKVEKKENVKKEEEEWVKEEWGGLEEVGDEEEEWEEEEWGGLEEVGEEEQKEEWGEERWGGLEEVEEEDEDEEEKEREKKQEKEKKEGEEEMVWKAVILARRTVLRSRL